MTSDDYVQLVISNYKLSTGPSSPASSTAQILAPTLKNWAGDALLDISLSGSYAKNTCIRGSADLDLFVSLSPNTQGNLKDIYISLYNKLSKFSPRRQNVSIGITYSGMKVDLIPGRKQPGNTNDHSVFKNKTQTWTQTNIQNHIDLVVNSGRLDEIRALKIWRNLKALEFPSFYLELTAIQSLERMPKGQLSKNIVTALEYLRDRFVSARVVDPANSNNIISEDLTYAEKQAVASKAADSLGGSWKDFIS